MIFKCVNCGGNVVYSPEKHAMYCPYCESENSEEIQHTGLDQELTICPDCGGEIPVKEHTSATQCPYCSNYLIFDSRVSGKYQPKKLIPFQLGKETCKERLREKFKKKVFAPTDFLSEVRLNSMEGTYVPFWMYDYDINADYQGEATRSRSWTSGDTRYTETSYYDVRRNADIDFRDIPVDASVMMPDDVMDLMEPYDYHQLEDFQAKYMSGFVSEKYNMEAELVEGRAREKMKEDTEQIMKGQVTGYESVRRIRNDITVNRAEHNYNLLPVWKYMYEYKGTVYPFYVNGQSGKIVGTVPISKAKVAAYSLTLWGCLSAICALGTLIMNFIGA